MARHGLEVPTPVPTLNNELQTLETLTKDQEIGVHHDQVTTSNIVRLLRFIPGKTLYEIDPWTAEHFYQVRVLIGQ